MFQYIYSREEAGKTKKGIGVEVRWAIPDWASASTSTCASGREGGFEPSKGTEGEGREGSPAEPPLPLTSMTTGIRKEQTGHGYNTCQPVYELGWGRAKLG